MGYMKSKVLPRLSLAEFRCEAQQVSDQMRCERCGLVWDMNDPDPPECIADPAAATAAGLKAILQDRRQYAIEQMAIHAEDPEKLAYWRGVRQGYTTAISLSEKYT